MTDKATAGPDALDAQAAAAVVYEVWCEVLEAGSIDPQTHFFDFGGHSIAAMRVMNALRREWGVTLPTRLIFEEPVLADFTAAAVRHLQQSDG